ncbi:MAG: DUF1552 domain-containing protein [Myxococcota bacterium]
MTTEKKTRFNPFFSRRNFLRGVGAGAALSPFLPLVNAQSNGEFPLRLVHMFFPHGTWHPFWRPTGGETDFGMSPILSPLERHRDKLLVLSGVDIVDIGIGTDHHIEGPALLTTGKALLNEQSFFRNYPENSGMEDFFYGWNAGPSFDQMMASRIGGETAYPSLEFAVKPSNPHPGHRISYTDAREPLAPESNPQAALERLFGSAAASAQELARLRAERGSVLDLVGREVERLRPRVASADHYKLDAHLDAIRKIELGLDSTVMCAGPDIGPGVNPNAGDNVPILIDQQFQLMAASLACDLTRIMSYQHISASNDQVVYRWPEVNVGRKEHHLISHERTEQGRDDLRKIYTWYMDRVAYFCDLLAAVPEGDGTLLDNTVIVLSSEIGIGYNHDYRGIPFVLLGGAKGRLRMGRHLDYGGIEHNRLIVSLFHAMGMEDVTTFGDDVGSGPLPNLV